MYPQFDEKRHVNPLLRFDPEQALVRSWDFGFHHPAVVHANIYDCAYGKRHYSALSEISNLFSISVWVLHGEVRDHEKLLYREARILDCGDKSGYRKTDSNRDQRGPIRILQDEYKLQFRYRFFDLDNSLSYVRSLLENDCDCGVPFVQIHPDCEVLIEGLKGGYRYSRKRMDNTPSDKPVKDKFYDDVLDAFRYGLENYIRFGMYQEIQEVKQPAPLFFGQRPWSWMEMSDEEFTKVLIAEQN